ncbi:MAG: DUF3368 domain-containing protein [Fimbriimonadaceae bacterium]|nr:DUF3368 domain-containing protein [Fimbriimonadaceae bacterium]
MNKIILSDTGPLISWSRAGQIPLLKQLVTELAVPPAVVKELNQPGRAGADLIGLDWIRPFALSPGVSLAGFPAVLGDGECEAIAAAEEAGAFLLVDDMKARAEAERRGIVCLTTLRLLLQAKHEGLIPRVEPVLRHFTDTGFRLSNAIKQQFLIGLGEV